MNFKYLSGILQLLLLIVVLISCHSNGDESVSPDFYSRITAVNKLVLGQATVTKMAVIDDYDFASATKNSERIVALINALKVGARKGIYSYDTYMVASVDLSELKPGDVTVDDVNHIINIDLPAVDIKVDGRDIQLQEEHYRVTGLRQAITAQERAQLKETMNELVLEEIKNNPVFSKELLLTAQSRGRIFFEQLLGRYGYRVVVNYK